MLNIASSNSVKSIGRCVIRLSVIQNHVAGQFRRVGRQMCTAASAAVTSHKAEVNGVQIHYEKTGTGNHNLLLLPGALGSTRTDFGPQLEKLNKQKYTIYAFDPRGYGRSIPPERDWPLEFLQRDAEDAVALMKRLNQPRFSVLGWSDGGITGLIVAGRYPDMLRRLVVWGANAYILPSDMPLFRKLEDISSWSSKMREPFVKLYGMDYFQKYWSKWIDAYGNYFEKRKGDICIREAKNVGCPTLIIHGQKDPLVVQEHPDFLHRTIPGSVLINWPEAKHNLHLRYADEFNSLVEDFLDKDN